MPRWTASRSSARRARRSAPARARTPATRASLDERDRIEAARSLLSSLTGDDYGDARVYLQSYTADGTQAVCTFGYYLSGVEAAAGSGIEIRFDGMQITRASVLYRRFTLDLQPAALLPAGEAEPHGIPLRY